MQQEKKKKGNDRQTNYTENTERGRETGSFENNRNNRKEKTNPKI